MQPTANSLNSREKRKAPRYRGKFPVELEQGWGVTRDFSTVGVFFETDQSFSIGQIIEFFFAIDHSDLGYSFRIRSRGCVRRLEPNQRRMGIAVALHSFSFEGIQEPEDIWSKSPGEEKFGGHSSANSETEMIFMRKESE